MVSAKKKKPFLWLPSQLSLLLFHHFRPPRGSFRPLCLRFLLVELTVSTRRFRAVPSSDIYLYKNPPVFNFSTFVGCPLLLIFCHKLCYSIRRVIRHARRCICLFSSHTRTQQCIETAWKLLEPYFFFTVPFQNPTIYSERALCRRSLITFVSVAMTALVLVNQCPFQGASTTNRHCVGVWQKKFVRKTKEIGLYWPGESATEEKKIRQRGDMKKLQRIGTVVKQKGKHLCPITKYCPSNF